MVNPFFFQTGDEKKARVVVGPRFVIVEMMIS